MKKIKLRILLIVAFSLLLLSVGCSKDNNNGADSTKANNTSSTVVDEVEATSLETSEPEETTNIEKGFTVVDMTGNKVEFDKTPEKIVTLLASDVEILYALGAQDSIVAVGEYCNYPSEALEKTVITTGDDLNMEQVMQAAPDVVIMGTMGQTEEQITKLKDAGIKVVITDSQNIADTYEAIGLLGQVSGKSEKAKELIDGMKADFKAISDKVTEENKKTVYFEVSPLAYGLWTAGQNTFMQEIADIVGVKNAFGNLDGWAEISEEQVLKRNPDYIVTVSMNYENDKTPSEEILSRKNWENINAVKNNKVISNETDMFTRPGPRLVDAAKELYDFVYGE